MISADWICGRGLTIRPAPFCPAGILNITPDSFSDGAGSLPQTEAVVERAKAMAEAFARYGCGMLDLGAESTRPGTVLINAEEEAARLLPPLKAVLKALPGTPVSVDTCRAAVAAKALDLGAHIINDVSACTRDAALTDILVQHQPGYVLTHGGAAHFARKMSMADELRRGETPADAILRFFERELNRLVRAGLPEDHIVLDPGIGFGKTGEENWAVLRHIERLKSAGRPIFAGLSRKSLFGWLLDLPAKERDAATQTAAALLAARGVVYHRVHNVKGCIEALRIAEAMAQNGPTQKME